MLKNKIVYIFTLLTLVFGFNSCEKYFGDINVNPNEPVEVSPNVLLPTIQARMAYLQGGHMSRYTSILTQHAEGISRQWLSFNNYTIVANNMDNTWFEAYSGVLNNIKQMRIQATAIDANYYVGMADILEAYMIMSFTDLFDAVPYSEALQGTDNDTPAFDSQESIYNAVFALLTSGKTIMGGGVSGLEPGVDDLIYGGNAANWVKFANAIEARAYLHLGLKDSANYGKALTAANNSFSSSADDANLQFQAVETQAAPWYQFNRDRTDIEAGVTIKSILAALSDPRAADYTASFTLGGAHPYFKSDRAWPFASYTEMQFVKAECMMQAGSAGASAAYFDGISSSFAENGVSADYATYITNPDVAPATLTMNEIMTQKYLALYMQPEVYNDWRRTGLPALTPNAGTFIPTRLPYSEVEIINNPNTPTSELSDKVWWDN